MIIGTNSFVSIRDAEYYYRKQFNLRAKEAAALVKEKLAAGEIFTGKPKVRPGEVVIIIDEGKRYAIKTLNPSELLTRKHPDCFHDGGLHVQCPKCGRFTHTFEQVEITTKKVTCPHCGTASQPLVE